MGSYTNLNYHIVFGTKYRRKTISQKIRPRLHEYIGGILRPKMGCLLEAGGIEDHIHHLTGLPAKFSVSDMLREIKAGASAWINSTFEPAERFEWQKGYGAFTVSYSQLPAVRNYIQNQREHHATMPPVTVLPGTTQSEIAAKRRT